MCKTCCRKIPLECCIDPREATYFSNNISVVWHSYPHAHLYDCGLLFCQQKVFRNVAKGLGNTIKIYVSNNVKLIIVCTEVHWCFGLLNQELQLQTLLWWVCSRGCLVCSSLWHACSSSWLVCSCLLLVCDSSVVVCDLSVVVCDSPVMVCSRLWSVCDL